MTKWGKASQSAIDAAKTLGVVAGVLGFAAVVAVPVFFIRENVVETNPVLGVALGLGLVGLVTISVAVFFDTVGRRR